MAVLGDLSTVDGQLSNFSIVTVQYVEPESIH
jgi:hypothetical protein